MTTLLDRETTLQVTDNADHDLFAHYIAKDDWEAAYMFGKEVRALCGKMWRPSKDVKDLPVCQTCVEVLDTVFPA